jgi:hypothetical protein
MYLSLELPVFSAGTRLIPNLIVQRIIKKMATGGLSSLSNSTYLDEMLPVRRVKPVMSG